MKSHYFLMLMLSSVISSSHADSGCTSASQPCRITTGQPLCGVCRRRMLSHELFCDTSHLTSAEGLFDRDCTLRQCSPDKCAGVPNAKSRCTSMHGTYECECMPGFTGQHCQVPAKLGKYAWANNIIFTPIFISSQNAKLYITLLQKGVSLKVKLDNGRGEELIYNEQMCKPFEKNYIKSICKTLFDDVKNIQRCMGRVFRFSSSWYGGCLMEMELNYPQRNDGSDKMIYEYVGGNASNSAVLGKLETVSLKVLNGDVNVFQQTFNMINVYDPHDECVPHVKLLNCVENMREANEMTRFREILLLSSLRIQDFETKCHTLDKVMRNWELWPVLENHLEMSEPPVLQQFDQDPLIIQANVLLYGVYKVRLTVTAVYLHKLVSGVGYCYFKVVRIPVQTVIIGGYYKKIHNTQNIHLEVVSQLVPNRYQYTPSNVLDIIYTWTCNATDSFCAAFETVENSRVISGPFRFPVVYDFSVSVKTKEIRSGFEETTLEPSAVQIIETTDELTPDFSIKCLFNCGGSVFKTNPQDVVQLEVTFSKESSLAIKTGSLKINMTSINWFFIKGIGEKSNPTEIENKMKKTPTSKYVLVLREDILSFNETYFFFVFSSKFSTFNSQTSTLPNKVSCTITPSSGTIGETYFNIHCTYHRERQDYTSMMYQFNNEDVSNVTGERRRLLGFSATGKIERVLLTKGQVSVEVYNLYGTYYEHRMLCKLLPPSQKISMSDMKFGNPLVDDYYYRVRKITAYANILGMQSKDTLLEAASLLLKQLVKESVGDSFPGALLMENAVHSIVCNDLLTTEIKKLDIVSVLSSVEIMYRVSVVLKKYVFDTSQSLRLMNTRRILSITNYTIQCFSVLLNETKSVIASPKTYKHIKTSVHYATTTLQNLAEAVALQVLPSLLEFHLDNYPIKVSVKLISSADSLVPPVAIYTMGNLPSFFTVLIVYQSNPYWWSYGQGINTDVKDFRVFHGTTQIPTYETNRPIYVELPVRNFKLAIIHGHVRQPDPNNSVQVNDFVVAVHRVIPQSNSVTFITFTEIGNGAVLRIVLLQDQRPDYDYMMSKSLVVKRFQQLHLSHPELHDDSFFFLGILPGAKVKVGESLNYSFELSSASCHVWLYQTWMSGNLCQVSHRSNHSTLLCGCRQIPFILGGQLIVPRNQFNPFSNLPLLIDVTDYPLIIAYMVCALFVYAMVMIWAKKKDQEDERHIYTILLEDNSPRDTFGYLVGVFTGWRVGAGTTSNVGLRLFGEEGISRAHVLGSSQRQVLTTNSDDWFLLFTPHHLGSLTKISLWIDYSGHSPNWYCNKVFVCDLTLYETDTFFVDCWFGITLETMIRLKEAKEGATYAETNDVGRVISENLVYGYREQHLLLSVFCKHPRALGTRSQRWTASISGFFVMSAVVALIYFVSTPEMEDVAVFNISTNHIVIALFGCLVGASMSFFLIHNFKGCYEFVRGPPGFHNHSKVEDMYHFERQTSEAIEDPHWLKVLERSILKFIKTWKLIPVQTKEDQIVGIKVNKKKLLYCWIWCNITFFLSWNMVVIWSFRFGKVKSLLFIGSTFIAIIIINIITSTIKIFGTAILVGISKTRILEIIPHYIGINRVLEDLKNKKSEEFEDRLFSRRCLDIYHPPDLYKTLRLEDERKRTVMTWVFLYASLCLFAFLLVTLWIISLNLGHYSLTNSIICKELNSPELCNNIHFSKLETMDQFVESLEINFLPALFDLTWYNDDNMTARDEQYAETGWLHRGMSRLVGPPRLRQFRIKGEKCHVPRVLQTVLLTCQPAELNAVTEERGNFSPGWTHDNWSVTLFDDSPWKFHEPYQEVFVRAPSGFPCHSGGYTISLRRTLGEAISIVRSLVDTQWVDQYTRIVIIDLTTFNPNTNILTTFSIVAETLPVGPVLTAYKIASITFISFGFAEVGVILFNIFSACRLIIFINIVGIRNYLKNLWNALDVFMWCVSAFVLNLVIRDVMRMAVYKQKLQQQGTDVFFDMQAFYSKSRFMHNSIGVLYWLVAFRLIRVVRFNSEVRQYLRDLNAAKHQMALTWLIIALFIFVQYRLIMFLVLPPPICSFRDILTIQSDFNSVIQQYQSFSGQLLAFLLSATSNIGMFSFILTFTHNYKNFMVQRRKSGTRTNSRGSRLTRLWKTAFD